MIIAGHINYFNVTECGLFKHGDSKTHGCELEETFDLIANWVQGRNFVDTIPWDPRESRSNAPKCYCRDIYKCETSGEYLVVLWKSDADSAGTLWGAKEDDATGQGKVVAYTNNYKGSKVIWGRPCYYWVIPNLNLILSIKFDHSVCDSQMMQDWVTRCITNRVEHQDKLKQVTEKGFVRLSFQQGIDPQAKRYSYRFDVKLRSLSTSSAELNDLAGKVTHIVRRETVRLQSGKDDRAEWIKVFDSIPYLNPKPKAKSRQIEIRAEAKPSAKELKEIIETFAKESRKNSDWDNVGFETDAGNTFWVDRYRLRETVNVNQESNEVFVASVLHSRLAEKRQELLGPIFRDLGISTPAIRTGTI